MTFTRGDDRAKACAGARVLRAAGLTLAGVVAYRDIARRSIWEWGASPKEARRAMPGDEVVADPFSVTTRAVTVKAPPSLVWPWLAQMGDGRGGLYSYDALDRLFGYIHGPSAETVLPQHQEIAVGDVIPLGRGPDWPVIACERERALVVEPVAGAVTWCFGLYPTRKGNTRLVSRVRVRVGPRPLMWLMSPLVDLPWFAMERRMLLGIRRRAEALAEEARQTVAANPVRPPGNGLSP
jgi:hypothetical protein